MAEWYTIPGYGPLLANAEDVQSWGFSPDETRIPSYQQPGTGEMYQWAPELAGREGYQGKSQSTPVWMGSWLLQGLDTLASGQPMPLDQQAQWAQVQAHMGLPSRDWRSLVNPLADGSTQDLSRYPSITDPDYLDLLAQVHAAAGQGDPQARQLLPVLRQMQEISTFQGTRKQDPFSPMGDPFFGAMGILGMAASLGAAAPVFAGTAGTAATLGAAGGLAGTAGGITGMFGEALDLDALRKAGIALGAAGGLTGAAGIVSGGINSLGDVLKLVQKGYGVGSKALGLAQGAGSTPDAPSGGVGSRTQAQTSGGSSTGGGAGGGGMELNQLGPILAGVVGLAGSGLSLADTARYMGQLKDQFGEQQDIKDLIDEAYKLAVARYETLYAQTAQEQQQKQTAYQDALEKYQTHYGQTQQEQQQKQTAYGKQVGQEDEDRARQIQTYQEDRGKAMQAYDTKVRQAQEDRDREINVYGADREKVLATFNTRVQEAAQDRNREVAVFDQQYARYQQDYDRRVAEAAQERGLDMTAYQARQSIGANLRDPVAIKAGAEALYQPLSELARGNISQQVQAEMASRGVTGGGQFANLMSAKAFAPSEQALWQNALQAYLSGQTGALNAYANMDLASSPEYRFQQVPNFTDTPQFQYGQVPRFEQTPAYNYSTVPTMVRSSAGNVPGTVGLTNAPGVPGAVRPPGAPGVSEYTTRPYAPFGSSPATGQAALGGLGNIVGDISKLLPTLFPNVFGSGNGSGFPSWANTMGERGFLSQGGDETQQGWYNPAYMDWGDQQNFDYSNLGDIDYSMF